MLVAIKHILLSDFNNGLIIVWNTFIHNTARVQFPISFTHKPTTVYGNTSRNSGDGWTIHPVFQNVSIDGLYIYQGQFQAPLTTNSNYYVSFIAIGF